MPRITQNNLLNELPLVKGLESEVKSWAQMGWQGVTQTTYDLLSFWFNRSEDEGLKFHNCQRQAIETIIYCHEVLGIKTLKEAYEKFAPEVLEQSAALSEEVGKIPFAKYCLKLATGTGKTWILAALLVWQYFNALYGNENKKYSCHFLLVAPGHEVLSRLLDMFKGKHDAKTGNREKSKSDLYSGLFLPEGERYKNRFNLLVLEPNEIRANFTAPDEPFVFITNWQQFRLKENANLWEQLTGEDLEDQPRGEIIADFLAEYPDLVIFNDEAHHVHGNKNSKGEDLVWRKFMDVLYARIGEHHKQERGVFLQIDFSATPFYGSNERKEYFSHIVYDFDLAKAMKAMLVKQIFLEERQSMAGERLEELDMRAERGEAEGDHRRGEILGLSASQKLLLDIGRKKMEQIATEFRAKSIDKKPVLFVMAENNDVANRIDEHLVNLTDELGRSYQNQILTIHSDKKGDMSEDEWNQYHRKLETLDEPEEANPIRVVVSVLMLREGFDTQNVAVIVVLRKAEANLLLEQVVGRGIRLMFPEYKYPELKSFKDDAAKDVWENKPPNNSFDFLFVVEHPQFKQFYEELRNQGYAIGIGDSTQTTATGDLVLVEATPERISKFDILWPLQVFDQSPKIDLSGIDPMPLPKYPVDLDTLKKQLSQVSVTTTYSLTGGKLKTWKIENEYFDFNHFLRQAAKAVAMDRKTQALTGQIADIMGILDEYATNRLFGRAVDFILPENYTVLNYSDVFDFVVFNVRNKIIEMLGDLKYEISAGSFGKVSEVLKIYLRESLSLPAVRCIYSKQGYSRKGEGFEKLFIDNILNVSAEVESFAKLQERKHSLNIAYRDRFGIKRNYFPDFVVKTKEKMYIVETKADSEIQGAVDDQKHLVALKAKAALSWCQTASKVNIENQPQEWEYILVSEKTFKDNGQLGAEALMEICRMDTKRLVDFQSGRLI